MFRPVRERTDNYIQILACSIGLKWQYFVFTQSKKTNHKDGCIQTKI